MKGLWLNCWPASFQGLPQRASAPCRPGAARPRRRGARPPSGGTPRRRAARSRCRCPGGLFEGGHDAQPVDAFGVGVVAVGHGLHHDLGRGRQHRGRGQQQHCQEQHSFFHEKASLLPAAGAAGNPPFNALERGKVLFSPLRRRGVDRFQVLRGAPRPASFGPAAGAEGKARQHPFEAAGMRVRQTGGAAPSRGAERHGLLPSEEKRSGSAPRRVRPVALDLLGSMACTSLRWRSMWPPRKTCPRLKVFTIMAMFLDSSRMNRERTWGPPRSSRPPRRRAKTGPGPPRCRRRCGTRRRNSCGRNARGRRSRSPSPPRSSRGSGWAPDVPELGQHEQEIPQALPAVEGQFPQAQALASFSRNRAGRSPARSGRGSRTAGPSAWGSSSGSAVLGWTTPTRPPDAQQGDPPRFSSSRTRPAISRNPSRNAAPARSARSNLE